MAGKQSRGRFIIGLIFCALVIGCIVSFDLRLKEALVADESLPVKNIVIDGALKRIDKREVAALAGQLCAGHNLPILDTAPLTQALMQIPWTARALVKKRMPDTLVVSLVEHVPAAYWNDNGLYDAVAQQVFYPDLTRFHEPLVRLAAPHDDLAPEVYTKAVLFMRALKPYGLQMRAVMLDNIRCFRIELINGTTLILGRDNEHAVVATRLKRFLQAMDRANLNLSALEYVDLRYDSGFAVRERAVLKQE
ncbi:MAG: FtsQ-type POTRA domain-containing protein [Candidatus Anaerobiospirillum merdipullorum]|uniref:FtsQ-type POTRA domain-containing protein n=1 Tax=Candidatus Anaerobiospirillum merdipullorum TaxID=2838450 RepID=A0A9E2NRJ4_9GAMM|nr:FtsQ-type POTRA domain-containing protein [Candidatus Anaerobiospirillum merdipullorum]